MNFYKLTRERLNHTPQRRKRWICNDFQNQLNITLNDIMSVLNYNFPKTDEDKKSQTDAIYGAIDGMHLLNKHILVYCNITMKTFSQVCNWCDYLRKEIVSLQKLLGNENMEIENEIVALDWDKMKSVRFVHNMSDLHRYIHGKVVCASGTLDNAESKVIVNLIDDAFYNVVYANAHIPKTKEEYNKRTKRLRKALSDLNNLQIPLLSYFNIMQYSDREQCEFAYKITEECKLLNGVLKSDKKRFSNLK